MMIRVLEEIPIEYSYPKPRKRTPYPEKKHKFSEKMIPTVYEVDEFNEAGYVASIRFILSGQAIPCYYHVAEDDVTKINIKVDVYNKQIEADKIREAAKLESIKIITQAKVRRKRETLIERLMRHGLTKEKAMKLAEDES